MAFERIAEQRIREAQQAGAFDRLPGAGRPVDLDGYFKMPEHLRMAYSVLKAANCLPEEVVLLNEIAALERDLAAERVPERRDEIARRLEARRVRLAIALERARLKK
jgi:hypothetical protein